MKLKYWIYAMRLHTLPLSITGITLSFLISKFRGFEEYIVYILCLITALFLQILANISNDYGDNIRGLYNFNSFGSNKRVQCSFISFLKIKKGIYLFSILSFISGLFLIYKTISINDIFIFFLYFLGIFICIYSSIFYSIGSKPYGYKTGISDLLVLFFFGIISVQGSYFLYTHTLKIDIFLLSLSIGLLNVAVLNINNIRDIDNDYKHGKYTMAVWLGIKYAKIYHIFIIFLSVFFGGMFIFLNQIKNIQWYFFIFFIFFIILHIKNIIIIKDNKLFNLELKKLIFITFLYGLSTGISFFL
ncbi:1,4-dihydroxy-2-naphthoate octaprenyltransferase [Blattabacterium cuenoti]|uniref:1,4-dihydroxy-2-naphthoate octaprenyltransferase n=1 Tax=Blattabacterium cuenoti TaxID=1653831 RepID=UPI00163C3311|nr:1,4-dihydroxy-2-naphthoate octaprenyltransferase [Blattabacterium cuenoti]